MQEAVFEICFRHEELVWHFFLDSDNQLCYRNSPKEKKSWSEPVVLQDNYGGQFVVALNGGEQIYLAATDKNNCIWYHNCSEGNWSGSMVAEVLPTFEVNNLSLTVDSCGRVHLLSCLRSSKKNMQWQITHNFLDRAKWHSFVLDRGTGPAEAKTSTAINSGNELHVIYSAPTNTETPLVHQIFEVSTKKWKEQEQIPLVHQENQHPCAVFDKRDNLHLVWVCSDGRNFRTIYTRRKNSPWPEGGWDTPGFISEKGANAYSPYILLAGERVIALWQQLDGVLYRVSADLGQTWLAIEKQTSVKNLDDYALSYFSLPDEDTEPLAAFSSNAPQITLSTAASLWGTPDLRDTPPVSTLMPLKENKALTNAAGKQLSPKARRFLLEYSDTRLTNKLMSQTIQTQEKNLDLLHQEKQDLNTKLKNQFRELKSFKALSEMYRKEAESLKQSQHRLEEKIKSLEFTFEDLAQEKAALDTAAKNLQEQLRESEQRENNTNTNLLHCQNTTTLLEARIYHYQQQITRLETALANTSRREDNIEENGPQEKKEIPYKMLTSDTYE